MRILQMNPPLIIAIAINGLDIMWHGIFAGSHFCEFSNGLQKLITANIFPGKIYFRVNILLLKLLLKIQY